MLFRLVSKAWAVGSYKLLARHLSAIDNCQMMTYASWARFMRVYNWGKFLSAGACKEVYCVQEPSGALAAVSVMDVDDLRERDMELAITQELEIAMLCSSLVSLNICPNLVLVHSLFQSKYPAVEALWPRNCPQTRLPLPIQPPLSLSFASQPNQVQLQQQPIPVPKQHKLTEGRYQYIRMEFCSGGDLEDLVRKQGQLDVPLLRNFLFQMCFSMYACREQLMLRHFDVKLLNFFVSSGSSLLSQLHSSVLSGSGANTSSSSSSSGSSGSYSISGSGVGGASTGLDSSGFNSVNEGGTGSLPCTAAPDVVRMHVHFGDVCFDLNLAAEKPVLVKLSDFGTSTIGSAALGDSISLQQYTTLENTPPEFLVMGNLARQAYSSDTFCLGA